MDIVDRLFIGREAIRIKKIFFLKKKNGYIYFRSENYDRKSVSNIINVIDSNNFTITSIGKIKKVIISQKKKITDVIEDLIENSKIIIIRFQ